MTPSNLILHSRPRAEADWECARKRFYLYEWDGTGLSADEESLEMFRGTSIHDGLAAIANLWKRDGKVDIDLIATTAFKQVHDAVLESSVGTKDDVAEFAKEQGTLVEGLMRGFYRHQWPTIVARWPRILAIETDVTYYHDLDGVGTKKGPFGFMAKPDLVVESDDGAEKVYLEYKSTSNKKDQWINSWDRTVQVHATREAIAQSLGIDCTAVVVQGLYTGYESYGKLASPMCYAYHRWGNPPFTQNETLYEYRSGFKRYPVWNLDGGVKKWVDEMPLDILMEQFPQTPLIFPTPDDTREFFAQRALRELEIRQGRNLIKGMEEGPARTALLRKHFPQTRNKCKPAWGYECPLQHLCFGSINDPLKAGMSRREPHHQTEVEMNEGA